MSKEKRVQHQTSEGLDATFGSIAPDLDKIIWNYGGAVFSQQSSKTVSFPPDTKVIDLPDRDGYSHWIYIMYPPKFTASEKSKFIWLHASVGPEEGVQPILGRIMDPTTDPALTLPNE